jgi:hypothetical protein
MPLGRTRAFLTVATATTATLLLAACSSDNSSGPKLSAAAQAANHYDSLSINVLAAATTEGDSLRAELAAGIAGVSADGTAPQSVNVTVNGTNTTWLGTFTAYVDSAGTDSAEILAAWSDPNVDTLVITILGNGDPETAAAAVAGGDINGDFEASNYAFSFSGGSGTCQLYTIQLNAQAFFWPTYDPSQSTCLPETSNDQYTYTFDGTDTSSSNALSTFVYPLQTVTGTRLAFNTTNIASHAAPVLSRIAAFAPRAYRFKH